MFSPRPPRWSQRACARSWRIRRPWKAGSLSWLQRHGFDMFRLKVGALWAPWNPGVYHWLIIILLVNMAILGGGTRSFEMWEDHMEGIEKMQGISPLCHCNIVKIYRIIFCVDDKVLITESSSFELQVENHIHDMPFALCMVKDCAEAVDARPNPDMKTQSVYSFGRPSARSRMADASGSVCYEALM